MLPLRRYDIFAFPFFVLDMIRIWRSMVGLVKKHDITIVQTHLLRSLDFLVLLLRYTTHLRAIFWTVHSANVSLDEQELSQYKWSLKPKRYAHNLLYRLTLPLVDGFIAVSDDVKEAMVQSIGSIQAKTTVIRNGVNVERYGHPVDKAKIRSELGLDPDARLIAVVATLTAPKGHSFLIKAMATVVFHHPDVHTLFIGDGYLREDLQAQVKDLNLCSHIHFLGNRADVPSLLAASDLFALPSLWEGLSMALLEAMAAGKPIVATAVSGTGQVLTHGETGLIVPPGDSQGLAEAIAQLLADPAQAQAMGHTAKKQVTMNFSAQKQADEHLTLYRQVLNSN